MWLSYEACILFFVGLVLIWLTYKSSVTNQDIPSPFLSSRSTQTEIQTFRFTGPTPVGNKTI